MYRVGDSGVQAAVAGEQMVPIWAMLCERWAVPVIIA